MAGLLVSLSTGVRCDLMERESFFLIGGDVIGKFFIIAATCLLVSVDKTTAE